MVALYWDGLGGYLKCCSIQRKPPLLSAALPQGRTNRSEEHDKLCAPSQLYTDSSPEIRDRSVTLKMSANTDQAWQKGCISRLGGWGTGQGKTSANVVKCTGSFSPHLLHRRLFYRSQGTVATTAAVRCGAHHHLNGQINPTMSAWGKVIMTATGGNSCLQLAREAGLGNWKLPAGTKFSLQLLLQHRSGKGRLLANELSERLSHHCRKEICWALEHPMLWQRESRQGLFFKIIQNKRQWGPEAVCALAEESGTYFIATAIHTGTQTSLCVIWLQHCLVVAAGAP